MPAKAFDGTQVALGVVCSLGGAGIALLGQAIGHDFYSGQRKGYPAEICGGMVILAGLYQICKGFGLNFRSPISPR